MKVNVKIFGIQELIDALGGKGGGEIHFSGGSVSDLFTSILERFGYRWEDFPLLADWERNLTITILHNGEILNKDEYSVKTLQDGDRLSFLLHTGCC
jgi:hypothetical protein